MNSEKLIKKLRINLKNKGYTIGSWLQISNSDISELFGRAGYDWIAVDLEHGIINLSEITNIFRAIELGQGY